MDTTESPPDAMPEKEETEEDIGFESLVQADQTVLTEMNKPVLDGTNAMKVDESPEHIANQEEFVNMSDLRDDANDMEKNSVLDEEEDDEESAFDPEINHSLAE